MEHLAKDDQSYKVNRNSDAEASPSTSKNSSSSSQMRKSLKLFAQTCNRFQIPDLHFYVNWILLPLKRRKCSLIKAKSFVNVSNKGEGFRAVIALWHQNQCKVFILILERTRP